VYSIDDSYRLRLTPVQNLIKVSGPSSLLQLHLEDNRILTVTPNHPNYVIHNNSLTVRSAADLKEGDLLPIAPNLNDNSMAWPSELIYEPSAPYFHCDNTSSEFSGTTNAAKDWGDLDGVRIQWIDTVPNPSPYVYCVQVVGGIPAFVAGIGGILTHNCFGYLGFKNSRFGRAEAHNATTAYSREVLLQATEHAEQRGYSVVHGIVDSLWLQKDGASPSDYRTLCQEVSRKIDIPFDFKGMFRWIVFLPSREISSVPVLNRYYGVKTDGELKLRGIELRRRDTPNYIRYAQEAMLKELAKAKTAEEWFSRVPEVYRVLQMYIARLKDRDVDPKDLVFKRRLTREIDAYQSMTYQAAAAHILRSRGIPIHAGQNVKYVIVNAEAKNPLQRVIPLQVLDHVPVRPDTAKYEEFLIRAFENILPPSITGFSARTKPNHSLTEFLGSPGWVQRENRAH
jgi:hypothetical protein